LSEKVPSESAAHIGQNRRWKKSGGWPGLSF
jgi:hypothetical protein